MDTRSLRVLAETVIRFLTSARAAGGCACCAWSRPCALVAAFVVMFACLRTGSGQSVELVKDIHSKGSSYSSNPDWLVEISPGLILFVATSPLTGTELYRSDGTAAGTFLCKDIRAGVGSSFPSNPRNVNGTLFFTADDGVNGIELWKSDGTAAGTVLVKDIRPGTINSFDTIARVLTNVNGDL